jgi:hypothetical protein
MSGVLKFDWIHSFPITGMIDDYVPIHSPFLRAVDVRRSDEGHFAGIIV